MQAVVAVPELNLELAAGLIIFAALIALAPFAAK